MKSGINGEKDPIDYYYEAFCRERRKKHDKERRELEGYTWAKVGVIASVIAAITGVITVVWNILQYLKIISN